MCALEQLYAYTLTNYYTCGASCARFIEPCYLNSNTNKTTQLYSASVDLHSLSFCARDFLVKMGGVICIGGCLYNSRGWWLIGGKHSFSLVSYKFGSDKALYSVSLSHGNIFLLNPFNT